MARKTARNAPLFPVPCIVCTYPVDGEHQPWCPQFLRGEADDAGEQMQIDSPNEKEAD